MYVPILFLMGIILYGTTQASKPPVASGQPGEAAQAGYTEMEPSPPLQRVEPPPPAPRLQSELEAEAQRQAEAERAVQPRPAADSLAQAGDSSYVAVPIVPGG